MIDSFTLKTELADKAERVVSSTFNIKLHGHIIPDIPQKDLTSLKKLPGINKVTVEEKIPGSNTIQPVPPPPWLLTDDTWSDDGSWNDVNPWDD
jgi:hypothetical protein